MSDSIGMIFPKHSHPRNWHPGTLLLPFLLAGALTVLCFLAYSSSPSVQKKPRLSWNAHPGSVNCLAFSSNGKTLASGCCNEKVVLWDALSGQKQTIIPYGAFRLLFAPDGHTLVIGTARSIVFWDVGEERRRTILKAHNGPVWSLVFSPGGETLASGGCSEDVILWDVAKAEEHAVLRSPTLRASIAFSPDGKILAAGGDDDLVRFWEIESGKKRTLTGHENEIKSVAFTPKGEKLISASQDGVVRAWDPQTGKTIAVYKAKDRIWSTALAPDGRTLALSVSDKFKVELWDVATGKVRVIFARNSEFVDSLAFSPDGRTLATGSVDHTISLWDVPP